MTATARPAQNDIDRFQPMDDTQLVSQLAALDRAVALSRVGGDLELLQEVAQLFLDNEGLMLSDIEQAIARRSASSLEMSAHSLKGSVSNFGAEPAVQAAQRLEQMGRNGQFAEAEGAYRDLCGALERLRPALADLAAH